LLGAVVSVYNGDYDNACGRPTALHLSWSWTNSFCRVRTPMRARHFLCQAPANRVDEMGGHAVGALCTVGKLARQASSSSAKMSERDPTLEIFSRPRLLSS